MGGGSSHSKGSSTGLASKAFPWIEKSKRENTCVDFLSVVRTQALANYTVYIFLSPTLFSLSRLK